MLVWRTVGSGFAAVAVAEQKTSAKSLLLIARQCGDYRTVPLI